MSKKYCLAVDLKNDDALINEYEQLHQKIPPVIKRSIVDSGIINMEIYRAGNRLFMVMETADDFNFEEKSLMDKENADVQSWEELMWKYQQALPFSKPGEKWILMNKIFDLTTNV